MASVADSHEVPETSPSPPEAAGGGRSAPSVFFLLPDLGYTAAARQVSLLAPGLIRAGGTATVYALGRSGPFLAPLRADGVTVLTSTGRHLRNWFLIRYIMPDPDFGVVHAFGLTALRRFWLATVGVPRPRVVLSLTGREHLSRLDRRPLRLVSRVVVPHATAADALGSQGVPRDRLAVVPPAVGEAPPPPDRVKFCQSLGIPPGAPLLLSAGRMDTRGPMFNSVWAFEFLRYTDPEVRLLMVGDGPARDRVEAGARGLAPEGTRVLFLGARPDVPALAGLADVVIAPQPAGGVNAALEGMAAGRPVVAMHTPDMAAVIADGRTGLLTRPNYPPGIAAAVRKLLLDPDRRAHLGAAAREHVRRHHSVGTVVRAMETVYRE